MANEITQPNWYPGTEMNCGCMLTIEQEHKTDENGNRVLVRETFVSAKKCIAHKDIPDSQILGKLKNDPDAEVRLLSAARFYLDNLDDLWQEVTDQDGKMRRELKPGKGFQLLFMGAYPRKLHIITFGHALSPDQKKGINDTVKGRVSGGKENLIVYE